jgi:hypothetical protein
MAARAKAGVAAKISAVDESYRRAPAPIEQQQDAVYAYERSRAEILDEKVWKARIRSERSAAYWFAASKWGMVGLIFGMVLGGMGMYIASNAAIPMAQDAMTRAAAINGALANDAQERADFSLPE